MNPVVSNASPLINLARIQRFDLLKQFYGRVTIPMAVYDEAEKLGVKITGTLGILARAKREGLIPNVRDEIARLQSQGTWIHPKLTRDILELVGELA